MSDTDAWQLFDAAARVARAVQAEVEAAGMGNPLKRENDRLRAEIERLNRAYTERAAMHAQDMPAYRAALSQTNERLRNLILHLAAHDPLRDNATACEPCSEIRQMLRDAGKQY